MTECFHCADPVDACTCGNTKTFETDGGPTCPFCGHQNNPVDSDGYLYDEGTDHYECDACERNFAVRICIAYSWAATRPATN
jgi:hypothetical protein